MKLLFENWRKYQTMMERINCLDPDSGKRFINDVLVEVTEEHNETGLSEEELNKIKNWAGLSGEPSFLGRGSRGNAYLFGDKVLKITNDPSEVKAAAAIIGKEHPNVYKILAVGRRNRQDMEQGSVSGFWVIIYEFLDYPNSAMIDVANQMYHKVRNKDKKDLYYSWKTNYLSQTIELINQFVDRTKIEPGILGAPHEGYGSLAPKIQRISDEMGWDDQQRILFSEFWGLDYDINPRKSLDSPENVEAYVSQIMKNPKMQYFHQLALGLTFLFENGVIFRDLKTSNVMEKNEQIAIIDIGYSTVRSDAEIPAIVA